MAVTVEHVAVQLGRPTPPEDSVQYQQWTGWIAQAMRAIRRRAERLGTTLEALNTEDVDDVVLWAVEARAKAPADGATSTTDQVQVDDAAVNRTRRYDAGELHITDQWWETLGLVEPLADGWAGSLAYSGA